jgi:hypothetical protein
MKVDVQKLAISPLVVVLSDYVLRGLPFREHKLGNDSRIACDESATDEASRFPVRDDGGLNV